jgi:hypothetical protein
MGMPAVKGLSVTEGHSKAVGTPSLCMWLPHWFLSLFSQFNDRILFSKGDPSWLFIR